MTEDQEAMGECGRIGNGGGARFAVSEVQIVTDVQGPTQAKGTEV